MEIHIIVSTIIIFLVGIISIFVLFNNIKSSTNKFFFFLCLSIVLWIASNILAHIANNHDSAIFFTRIAIIWTSLLPPFFNALIKRLYFVDNQDYKKMYKVIFIFSVIVVSFFILFNSTYLNIISISMKDYGIDFEPGVFYYILFVYLLISFGFSFISLLKIIKHPIGEHGPQAKIILLGSFITVMLSIILDIILPIYGYSEMSIYAPSTALFFVLSIGFAITKHRLFKIRVVVTEIILLFLWVLIFINILINNNSKELILDISLLVISIILGIVMIKNILHTLDQDKKIEELNSELFRAYNKIKEVRDTTHLPINNS